MLVPAAIIAGAPAAQAKIFMDIEQAQELMFPGQTFEQHFITLDQNQFNAIIKDSNVNVYNREVKAWKASNGGWFIIDQVRGKDDWISYAISLSPDGKVLQVEILECLENYAGITHPDWRAQFYGGRRGTQFEDVIIISGSTLSCGQMVSGVRRVLSMHALVLSKLAG